MKTLKKNLFGIALVGAVSLPLGAVATPVVYGLLNKELRSVSQDADANTISKININDVDGFESRIGVKGTLDSDDLNMDYKIELGLNSDRDSSGDSERLRIRLAFLKLNKSWGSILLGKSWTPGSIRLIQLDPLSGTSLQAYGLDFNMINSVGGTATTITGLGYRFRYFQDQVTFQTNDYSGFRYHLTIDDNSKSSQNTLGDDGQFITHALTWDRDFGNIKNNFTLIYSGLSYEKSTSHEEKNMQIANKLMFGNSSVSLGYGSQTVSDDGQNKRMFLAYAYSKDKNKYALTLSDLAIENASGDKTLTHKLLGFGWFHKLTSSFTVRTTLGSYSVTSETADLFNGGFSSAKKENNATLLAVGGMLKF